MKNGYFALAAAVIIAVGAGTLQQGEALLLTVVVAAILGGRLVVAAEHLDAAEREIQAGENKRRMLVYQVDGLRRDCRFLRSRLAVQPPPMPECPEEDEDDKDEGEEPQGIRELAEE